METAWGFTLSSVSSGHTAVKSFWRVPMGKDLFSQSDSPGSIVAFAFFRQVLTRNLRKRNEYRTQKLKKNHKDHRGRKRRYFTRRRGACVEINKPKWEIGQDAQDCRKETYERRVAHSFGER
jgi:hypothetical protein